MRWPLSGLVGLVALLAAGPALAHAFPQRHDLALPLGHYVAGAGAAVAASFLIAVLAMRPGWRAGALRLPVAPGVARVARVTGAVLGLAVFAVLIASGLFGEQREWQRNPLPVVVWVCFWVGLLAFCAVIGNLWPLLNPWAALGRLAFPARPAVDGQPPVWPAVALFFAFAWAELVWPRSAMPGPLVTLILGYTLLTLVAMALMGTENWLRRGEVFAVVFSLYGRVAVAGWRDGALEIRPPGAALARGPAPDASRMALVLLLVAVVSFDGFAETPLWSDIAGAGIGLLYRVGLVAQWGYGAAGAAVKTAGIAAAWGVVALLYLATMRLVARGEGAGWGETARAYAPTLLPIAVGYHVAHYTSYLMIEAGRLPALASDPFGRGWDLFGAAGRLPDPDAVNMQAVWLIALCGIVGGHVVAVVAAHGRALSRLSDPRRAARAQLPLVILMTLYTMSSLWIMAQPIVSH